MGKAAIFKILLGMCGTGLPGRSASAKAIVECGEKEIYERGR